MKRTLYLLAGILLLFAGCKKDDEKKDLEQQFIGTWQQVSVAERANGGSWQDVTDPCDLQEIVEINADSDHGLRLYSAQPSQCGSQVYLGHWDIFDNGQEMIWNIDGLSDPIKKEILEISEHTLITVHDAQKVTPTEIKITYKKQ